MPTIPFINKEFDPEAMFEAVNEKINNPRSQRKIILVIVCVALLLDNMLYMVIVPIIPDYLRSIGAWDEPTVAPSVPGDNGTNATSYTTAGPKIYSGEDVSVGVLFASKALVQIFFNPFTGALIDRIGYDIPMMVGLIIMFMSTAIFAFGESYGTLFVARSLQGVGSAFADTSGLGMIADRFTEEQERTTALGIALAFISFGCLAAPPFGGFLYQFAGKRVPFLALSTISLLDGVLLMFVMKPIRRRFWEPDPDVVKPKATPIWRLLMDPYIAICAGALSMSNVSLAFLEPTIAIWMRDTMQAEQWQIGMIWLPGFFPHVLGVYLTVRLARTYSGQLWLIIAIGLALEGLFTFIVPAAKVYSVLIVPIMGICFGIALVDTAVLPTLGYIVDIRHASVYGSIYAIADISYSLMYAFGPIIAGSIVQVVGFDGLNIGIALSNLVYVPILILLKNIYKYKPFKEETEVVYNSEPPKTYGGLEEDGLMLNTTLAHADGGTTLVDGGSKLTDDGHPLAANGAPPHRPPPPKSRPSVDLPERQPLRVHQQLVEQPEDKRRLETGMYQRFDG